MEDARKINRRYDELMDTQNEIFQAGQPGWISFTNNYVQW